MAIGRSPYWFAVHINRDQPGSPVCYKLAESDRWVPTPYLAADFMNPDSLMSSLSIFDAVGLWLMDQGYGETC